MLLLYSNRVGNEIADLLFYTQVPRQRKYAILKYKQNGWRYCYSARILEKVDKQKRNYYTTFIIYVIRLKLACRRIRILLNMGKRAQKQPGSTYRGSILNKSMTSRQSLESISRPLDQQAIMIPLKQAVRSLINILFFPSFFPFFIFVFLFFSSFSLSPILFVSQDL